VPLAFQSTRRQDGTSSVLIRSDSLEIVSEELSLPNEGIRVDEKQVDDTKSMKSSVCLREKWKAPEKSPVYTEGHP